MNAEDEERKSKGKMFRHFASWKFGTLRQTVGRLCIDDIGGVYNAR